MYSSPMESVMFQNAMANVSWAVIWRNISQTRPRNRPSLHSCKTPALLVLASPNASRPSSAVVRHYLAPWQQQLPSRAKQRHLTVRCCIHHRCRSFDIISRAQMMVTAVWCVNSLRSATRAGDPKNVSINNKYQKWPGVSVNVSCPSIVPVGEPLHVCFSLHFSILRSPFKSPLLFVCFLSSHFFWWFLQFCPGIDTVP